MEVENVIEVDGAGDNLIDLENQLNDGIKVPVNPAVDSAADRVKRKAKRIVRHNSREAVVNGGGGSPSSLYVAPQRRWKNSRRSRNNGHGRGLPKKGGAGGKGVWGKMGSEMMVEEDFEDQNDPNYDSEINDRNTELREVIPEPTPEEFFRMCEPIILEYFHSGDTHEVAVSLDEILVGGLRQLVTSVAVEIAMDHKDSHREMISVLISDLYGRVITPKDIIKGEVFSIIRCSIGRCKFISRLNRF